MKTILVPVDFSTSSKNAMDYAILLANKLRMKLILFHAFEPSGKFDTLGKVENELKIWKEAVLATEKTIPCEVAFEEGELAEEIIELMKEKAIDLIVMGTKGASGLKEAFIGSKTSWVMENVSIPVIAVPAECQFSGIKKIVFATDYHDSDVASIRFAAKIARRFHAELTVVHIATGDLKARFEDHLMQHFTGKVTKSVTYEKMNFRLLEANDVSKALNDFIYKEKVDLFAIAMEERIFLGPLFNRGLTKRFAHHIQTPLLSFRAYENDDNSLF